MVALFCPAKEIDLESVTCSTWLIDPTTIIVSSSVAVVIALLNVGKALASLKPSLVSNPSAFT